MKREAGIFLTVLVGAGILTGCATGGNQVESAVYQTARHVENLERSLQGSVQQLNQTAAGLLARVDANEQALRSVSGQLEENRAKLDSLEKRLDSLIRTYQRQPQRTLTAPGAGQSEIEIGDQDFVVEDPDGAVRR